MNKRLFITGGAGYLGSELIEQGLQLGWTIAATSHQKPLDNPHIQAVSVDIRDQDAIQQALHSFKPDTIIHTAFRQHNPSLWETSAQAPSYIAAAAKQLGAQLVHLSSDAIFDGTLDRGYTEDDPPSPITDYGKAKAAAEQFVIEQYPEALIVRTSLIYGGKTLSNHEQTILSAIDGHSDIRFFSDEMRCPIVVHDLAQAIFALLNTSHTGIINIAGSEPVSRYQFACLVAQAHQRPTEAIQSGLSAESGLNRPRNCVLDIRKIQQLISTKLRGVTEFLQNK